LRATDGVRHVLAVQQGFTLFIVFNVPIEFVAIGDEQLLAIAVRATSGVIALKATQRTGRTNLHVHAGGMLTVFEIRISGGGRSADVVHVTMEGGLGALSAGRPAPAAIPLPGPPASSPSAPPSPPRTDLPESTPAAPPTRAALGRTFLNQEEVFQVQELTESGIHGAFQAYRTAAGIEIRYSLTNSGNTSWKVSLSRVLVRADGRIITIRTARPSGEGTPDLLTERGTVTGLLVLGQHADNVELLFPLFPPAPESHRLPLIFTVQFSELMTLIEVNPR